MNLNLNSYEIAEFLGYINLTLIIFQLLTGFRVIKFKNRFKLHKGGGILLLITAMVHAILALNVL